jgi:hypothetical protein
VLTVLDSPPLGPELLYPGSGLLSFAIPVVQRPEGREGHGGGQREQRQRQRGEGARARGPMAVSSEQRGEGGAASRARGEGGRGRGRCSTATQPACPAPARLTSVQNRRHPRAHLDRRSLLAAPPPPGPSAQCAMGQGLSGFCCICIASHVSPRSWNRLNSAGTKNQNGLTRMAKGSVSDELDAIHSSQPGPHRCDHRWYRC